MNIELLNKLSPEQVNKIRAELDSSLTFQVAHINLESESDPSAILNKYTNHLTIASDRHSYSKTDRIFPINQDENTAFAQFAFRDSTRYKYSRVLDLCTGSGVIAMALAKAGASEVIATDINPRAGGFIEKNNQINELSVKFLESDLFESVRGSFDKITINPPFMPAPEGIFPLHAQGGNTGIENIVRPFFERCWGFVNKGGCIQGIFNSFANEENDTVLDLLKEHLPSGWSYEIMHVFPVKDVPIELYTTSFVGQNGYENWIAGLNRMNFRYMRFFMLTIRNDGRDGMVKEEFPKPRIYNLIYPPTTLVSLSKQQLKTKLLNKPVSEEQFPMIGHMIRLSRYNYFVYITLSNLFK